MDREKSELKLIYSSVSSQSLNEIWRYNAERYSIERADDYIEFLIEKIQDLQSSQVLARLVEDYPKLQSILVQKRPRKDGHVVVFELNQQAKQIVIHFIFHTKQNWLEVLHSQYEE